MDTLQPLKSPSGHDAYCHVCWEPVYRFWVAKEPPDYARCAVGDFTAQTCPNAVGPARLKAAVARLKEAGLWVGSLGASLAAEATTALKADSVGIREADEPSPSPKQTNEAGHD